MIDPKKLQSVNFNNPAVKIPEWIINILCLGYGIYAMSPFLIILGILACLSTYFGLLSRMNKWLDSFVKRRMI